METTVQSPVFATSAGKKSEEVKSSAPQEFRQEPSRAGLLVTDEYEKSVEQCKARVAQIAQNCRRRNRRFRDIEFDLEEDRDRCLHGLTQEDDDDLKPSDVLRVPQIFTEPAFYIDGATSSDIVQGALGDCWFLSALATLSTMPGLIEKICVARDEEVGVYGFLFWRDESWKEVIVDDLLYIRMPKYDELSDKEQKIYKYDRDFYNSSARRGSKALYFASSGTENETWVPLIEKAYAKLCGDYIALSGGQAVDAIEDMTGGVSQTIHPADIMSPNRFWEEELLHANDDRLFGCAIGPMTGDAAKDNVKGIMTGHAYSVIRVSEVAGKRFVKIRNPWGNTEWSGRWSDGSKEWTQEWLARLPELQHKFGDDGEFLMEYSEFLSTFNTVERARLFDSSWRMSSQFLNVATRSFPAAWRFGDVSFTVSVPESTPAVIQLSKLDTRQYKELDGPYQWSLEFAVYKRGSTELVTTSSHDALWGRSVMAEIDLEKGEYVVHVRLDRNLAKPIDFISERAGKWNGRKRVRKLAEMAQSLSIASNFDPSELIHQLPLPVDVFNGSDLTELELASHEAFAKKAQVGASLTALALAAPDPQFKETNTDQAQPEEPEDKKEPPTPAEEKGESEESDVASPAEGENAVDGEQSNTALPDEDKKDSEETGPVDKPESESKVDGEENDSADKPESESKDDAKDVAGKGSDTADTAATPSPPAPATDAKPAPAQPEHEGVRCDICSVNPIVGPRYKCLDSDCPDYDLCQKCMDSGVHPASHRMLRLNTKPDGEPLYVDHNPAVDDVVVGLKVYTKLGAPATIKGQLRHGKVLRWAKETKQANVAQK